MKPEILGIVGDALGLAPSELTDVRWESVSGGDINQSFKVSVGSRSFFLKTHPKPPATMYRAESHGLRALAEQAAAAGLDPMVPEVIGSDTKFLILPWIPGGNSRDPRAQEALGRALALIHSQAPPHRLWGWPEDNFLGTTIQRGGLYDHLSWPQYFASHRLGYLSSLVFGRGCDLPSVIRQLIEKLEQERFSWMAMDFTSSLVHGDLWGGNFMVDQAGHPWLIDPAVYCGHREVDLAMTRLFGGFSPRFYRGYEEILPLEDGWEFRFELYNLYHILNHALIFGGGYKTRAQDMARRLLTS